MARSKFKLGGDRTHGSLPRHSKLEDLGMNNDIRYAGDVADEHAQKSSVGQEELPAMHTQERVDEYNRRGWKQDATTSMDTKAKEIDTAPKARTIEDKTSPKPKKAESSGKFSQALINAENIGDASKALDILGTVTPTTKGETAVYNKALRGYKKKGGIATQY